MSKNDKYDRGQSVMEVYELLKEDYIALKQENEECNAYIETLLQIMLAVQINSIKI